MLGLAFVFTLALSGAARAEPAQVPSGVKNSQNLGHYRQRLKRAVVGAELRYLRGLSQRTGEADALRKRSTLLKLRALRLEADRLTPAVFARVKAQAVEQARAKRTQARLVTGFRRARLEGWEFKTEETRSRDLMTLDQVTALLELGVPVTAHFVDPLAPPPSRMDPRAGVEPGLWARRPRVEQITLRSLQDLSRWLESQERPTLHAPPQGQPPPPPRR